MTRDKASSTSDVERSAGDERQRIVMPVIAERLHVEKKLVERAVVRISKELVEREQTVDVPLEREVVSVERVPVGREIDTAPEVRTEGDTLIIPVVVETLVIEKRLVLSEEIHVTRRRERAQAAPAQVRLREERVRISRVQHGSPEELSANAHVSAASGPFASSRRNPSTAPMSGGHRQIVATSSRRKSDEGP